MIHVLQCNDVIMSENQSLSGIVCKIVLDTHNNSTRYAWSRYLSRRQVEQIHHSRQDIYIENWQIFQDLKSKLRRLLNNFRIDDCAIYFVMGVNIYGRNTRCFQSEQKICDQPQ